MSGLHWGRRQAGGGRFVAMMVVVLVSGLLAACQASPTPQAQAPSFLDNFSLGEITVSYDHAERPLLVADLDGEISQSLAGNSAMGAIGTRLGVVNRQGRQAALEQAITATVTPHVREQLTPLFRGARPARADILIRSVFIRSRFGLQQLTGANVTINGQKRPDNPQLIAELMLYDQETGFPLQRVGPITRIDDGTIIIAGGGPKAPDHSSSKRLNQLAFEFARAAANALRQNASGDDFTIPGSQGDVRVLWSSQLGG